MNKLLASNKFFNFKIKCFHDTERHYYSFLWKISTYLLHYSVIFILQCGQPGHIGEAAQ